MAPPVMIFLFSPRTSTRRVPLRFKKFPLPTTFPFSPSLFTSRPLTLDPSRLNPGRCLLPEGLLWTLLFSRGISLVDSRSFFSALPANLLSLLLEPFRFPSNVLSFRDDCGPRTVSCEAPSPLLDLPFQTPTISTFFWIL